MTRERSFSAGWLLVALSPVLDLLGFAIGSRWLLPIFSAGPAYLAMVILLRRRTRAEAIGAMLVWALLHGMTMTLLTFADPVRAAGVVLNGPAYWREMAPWLETGIGRESIPSEFLPQHLLHAGAFVLLCLLTASALGILLGAVLMNYMAYYVGHVVILTPARPALAALLAWHPWSLVRIAAFVILGVCLAEPLLRRLGAIVPGGASKRPWLLTALVLLVIDLGAKALLAPHWAGLLRALR